MAAKLRIAIVGAGNLATALAVSLQRAGFRIAGVIGRSSGRPSTRARTLAKQVGAPATADLADVKPQLVWLCVPDSEIARTARSLAEKLPWQGKIALHSSGALTSDELDPLRRKGAAVASVHPLMTFVPGSRPSLASVPFAVEGDRAAVRVARRMVRDLGGQPYSIAKRDKAAYHAWGTFASPLLTALLATTERVAAVAGVKHNAARRRMIPILQQTLANYAALGAPGAFSGPLIRGDVDTVRRHLRVLRRTPAVCQVYSALARAALDYLPVKNRNALRRLLEAER